MFTPPQPKLDTIAVRVHDPSKLSVRVFFARGDDLHALALQDLEKCVEVVNAVVDHALLTGLPEVVRVVIERRPHGHAPAFGPFVVAPAE